MTTDQLKNFLIVAEVLNFHKASNSIYIAQPALSRQIKNLEEEVGAELFDRTRKQIKLTAAGVLYRNEVTRILNHLSEAKRRAGEIHRGEAGEINIGHASSAMSSVLPHFIKTITTSYPNMKIGLLENSCRVICDKILNRELHFGVTPYEAGPKGIQSVLLYKENFVVVMPKSFKINLKKNVSLKTFANTDWILPAREDGHDYHNKLYRLFHKHGFTPKVVFQSPNATTNLRMVSEGLGVTIIAKSAVKGASASLKYAELTEIPEKVEMHFIWLKEREDELKEYMELFLGILKGS